jgi:hypothetical protein
LKMRRLKLANILRKSQMGDQESFYPKKPALRTFLSLAGTGTGSGNGNGTGNVNGTATLKASVGTQSVVELRFSKGKSQSPLLSPPSPRKPEKLARSEKAEQVKSAKPRIPKFMTTLSVPHFMSPCPSRGTLDITLPSKGQLLKEHELGSGNYAGRLLALILDIVKYVKCRSDDIRLLSNSSEPSPNPFAIELYGVEQLLEKIELNEQARAREEAKLLNLLEQVRVEEQELKR